MPKRKGIHFNYTLVTDQVNNDHLKEYIRLGELIRNGPDFENSAFWHLEKFIVEGRFAVERYLGSGAFNNANDNLEKTFYAIIAPSMEGKTQSAFVFRDAKPLYFVMPYRTTEAPIQAIYENFDVLTQKLIEFSDKDVEYLRVLNVTMCKSFFHIDFDDVAEDKLTRECLEEKFYVLGFFKALMLDAISNHTSTSDISWMEYYATKPKYLEIKPISISEMLEFEDRRDFFLFMDEFTYTLPNLFIRNLARAAKIRVVVASTKVNVANLAGQVKYNQQGLSAWSVVFVKLNSLSRDLILQMVPDFMTVMRELYRKVRAQDRLNLKGFFDNFLDVQIKKLRPGFALLIASAMKEFNRMTAGDMFSLNDLLCKIVHYLGSELVRRNPMLLETYRGLLATEALYCSGAYTYKVSNYKHMYFLFHLKEHVRNHYYYLTNPVDLSKFCFLTYLPDERLSILSTDESEYPTLETVNLQLHLGAGKLVDWCIEWTTFEKDEIIPFLAFLGIWHGMSIAFLSDKFSTIFRFKWLFVTGRRRSYGVHELMSTVCLANASHRNVDSPTMTFTGLDCRSFLTNLIKNMIYANNCRINSDYQVHFPDDGITGTIFDRIHVPFLFPANLPIPTSFWTKLSTCNRFHDRSIHLGKLERYSNPASIDYKFNFFMKKVSTSASGRILAPSKGICTVESKYWQKCIGSRKLLSILGKARRSHSNLSIVICKSVSANFNLKPFSDFKEECVENKWEVLKVVQVPTRTGGKIFRIQRFHPEICLPDSRCNYSMTCIILELDVINA